MRFSAEHLGTRPEACAEIPRAKAHCKLDCFFRWTEVQLPLLKQRAPTGKASPEKHHRKSITGKAFSGTGNPVYPEKGKALCPGNNLPTVAILGEACVSQA
jgi:hypothetical protein